ncbi:MAG: hypothetical protein O2960_09675 [Verrucomicrobia bacterium]|nr:hypothetical protein [Verrucomicrobiota bacterium]
MKAPNTLAACRKPLSVGNLAIRRRTQRGLLGRFLRRVGRCWRATSVIKRSSLSMNVRQVLDCGNGACGVTAFGLQLAAPNHSKPLAHPNTKAQSGESLCSSPQSKTLARYRKARSKWNYFSPLSA